MLMDLESIIAVMKLICTAGGSVCDMIDQRLEQERGQKQALKELRDSVEAIKTDILVYMEFMNATQHDYDSLAAFTQRSDSKAALEGFEDALLNTQSLFEQNRGVTLNKATVNLSGNRRPSSPLDFISSAINPDTGSAEHSELAHGLKDALHEVESCQRKNDTAFKHLWNLYSIDRQHPSCVDPVGDAQEGSPVDSFSQRFHAHPFAVVAQEANSTILARLNDTHDAAAQHEELARDIGRAWVNDRVQEDTEVQDLVALQTYLFELLWSGTTEQLRRLSVYCTEDPDRVEFETELEEFEKSLQEAILRSKKQRFTIAFCGTVKAGKSLFLNALIGRAILPSDELPSTAWPCRIRHVEGRTVPELEFDATPFLAALKNLQDKQYGQKMQVYEPRTDDIWTEILSDQAPPEPSEEEVKLRTIYSQWVDLHPVTRQNLLKFENPGFQLPKTASGEQEVKDLLGRLNDIVRLCQRFDLNFDTSKVDWPLLTVEFTSLRDHRIDGIYEFIDLPGIEENFHDFNFESLVSLIATDSNAIVPVVSFEELPRSGWTYLPKLVAAGFEGGVNTVVCTHFDQVGEENLEEQVKVIKKTFWPTSPLDKHRVLPCSSLMGLSAMDLLEKSQVRKPPFEVIWDKHSPGYFCAEQLLGRADARSHYLSFDHTAWVNQLRKELKQSRLPPAIQRLTRDIVDSARVDALIIEARNAINYLRNMARIKKRRLLEARRYGDECEAARNSYSLARGQFQAILAPWNNEEQSQINQSHQRLERASHIILQKAYSNIDQAIEETLKNWMPRDAQSNSEYIPQELSIKEEKGIVVLAVNTTAQGEEFLRLSQRELHATLNHLKLEYVMAIRKQAEDAMKKRFDALCDAIKRLDPNLQPELCNEITNDLESPPINIQNIVFKQLRKVIKPTVTRHTPQTAFRAAKRRLIRSLLIPQKPPGKHVEQAAVEEVVQRIIDELGFMVREPTTVLATIPVLFGLPMWPWTVYRPQSPFAHLPEGVESGEREIFEFTLLDYVTASDWAVIRERAAHHREPATQRRIWVICPEEPPHQWSHTPHFDLTSYFELLGNARGRQLPNTLLGNNVLYGEAVTSTQGQLTLNPRIANLLPCPLLSLATFQLQDGGRNHRHWLSPYGVLQWSLLLELPPDLEHLTRNLDSFTHLVGLTVVETCRLYLSSGTVELALKWPNDLYASVDGRFEKVGGIVVNSIPVTPGSKNRILIGCGLNVRNNGPLCSLSRLTSTELSMEGVLAKIMAKLSLYWDEFLLAGGSFSGFEERYKKCVASQAS